MAAMPIVAQPAAQAPSSEAAATARTAPPTMKRDLPPQPGRRASSVTATPAPASSRAMLGAPLAARIGNASAAATAPLTGRHGLAARP